MKMCGPLYFTFFNLAVPKMDLVNEDSTKLLILAKILDKEHPRVKNMSKKLQLKYK